jgi:putative MATE family efflux protein
MKAKPDLLNDDVRSLFFRYLFPSVGGSMVTAIYILVDVIMIGKGVGGDAVAALNIVLPLYALFFGLGFLFGMGGSVLMSVSLGRGDVAGAGRYYATAAAANAASAVLLLIFFNALFEPVIQLLGATPTTAGMIREYGRVMLLGTPFYMFSAFLQVFLKNDRAQKLAMIGVVTGGVLNIILDYLFIFVFKWGIVGASWATVIANAATVAVMSAHFLTTGCTLRLRRADMAPRVIPAICKNGLSLFLIEVSWGMVVFVFNLQLLRYVGDVGVTVYGILANVAIIVISLCNGIAQAAQPILSYNYGARRPDRVRATARTGMLIALALGAAICLAGVLFPAFITEIFLIPTQEIYALSGPAITLYFLSFTAMAGNIFLNTWFQSVLKAKAAFLLTLLRGFALSVALVYVLPLFMGLTGIWLAIPFAETLTLAIALVMMRRWRRADAKPVP